MCEQTAGIQLDTIVPRFKAKLYRHPRVVFNWQQARLSLHFSTCSWTVRISSSRLKMTLLDLNTPIDSVEEAAFDGHESSTFTFGVWRGITTILLWIHRICTRKFSPSLYLQLTFAVSLLFTAATGTYFNPHFSIHPPLILLRRRRSVLFILVCHHSGQIYRTIESTSPKVLRHMHDLWASPVFFSPRNLFCDFSFIASDKLPAHTVQVGAGEPRYSAAVIAGRPTCHAGKHDLWQLATTLLAQNFSVNQSFTPSPIASYLMTASHRPYIFAVECWSFLYLLCSLVYQPHVV